MTPRRALVTWEDCFIAEDGTWVEKGAAYTWKPFVVESMGFVIYDGPEGIALADSWSDQTLRAPCTQIPRGMIRKVVYESPKPEKRRRKV